MAYIKTVWEDRDVTTPNNATITKAGGGTISSGNEVTLVAAPGITTKTGTGLTATRLNNIENGIESLDTVRTFFKISETVVSGATVTSITISGLSGYSFINIKGILLGTVSSQSPYFTFNADTGNNYDYEILAGTPGSHTSTYATASSNIPLAFSSAGHLFALASDVNPAYINLDIENLSATFYKALLFRATNDFTSKSNYSGAGNWRNTADLIDSITITLASGYFRPGSKLIAYGMK